MDLKKDLKSDIYTDKISDYSSNDKKDFIDKFNQFKNYSHEELLSEFIKRGTEMKNAGKLDKEKIESICNMLSPALTDEQKNNLKDLLKLL